MLISWRPITDKLACRPLKAWVTFLHSRKRGKTRRKGDEWTISLWFSWKQTLHVSTKAYLSHNIVARLCTRLKASILSPCLETRGRQEVGVRRVPLPQREGFHPGLITAKAGEDSWPLERDSDFPNHRHLLPRPPSPPPHARLVFSCVIPVIHTQTHTSVKVCMSAHALQTGRQTHKETQMTMHSVTLRHSLCHFPTSLFEKKKKKSFLVQVSISGVNLTLNNRLFPVYPTFFFLASWTRSVLPTEPVMRPYVALNQEALSPRCAPTSAYNHDGRHQMIGAQPQSSSP